MASLFWVLCAQIHLAAYLREREVHAEIVTLSGAVEIAPRLGRADAICDLVSTGSTLQANHLREVETILESHAVLIRTPSILFEGDTPRPAGCRPFLSFVVPNPASTQAAWNASWMAGQGPV